MIKGVCDVMNLDPETRSSLLIRVRNPADRSAWEDFVEIYRPLIVRLATQMRMQPADAEDVAQQVLLSVAGAVDTFDPKKAKFRTWLNRVARNAILNALTRCKPDRGSGDSEVVDLLLQQAQSSGPGSALVELEYRRQVFRWAA